MAPKCCTFATIANHMCITKLQKDHHFSSKQIKTASSKHSNAGKRIGHWWSVERCWYWQDRPSLCGMLNPRPRRKKTNYSLSANIGHDCAIEELPDSRALTAIKYVSRCFLGRQTEAHTRNHVLGKVASNFDCYAVCQRLHVSSWLRFASMGNLPCPQNRRIEDRRTGIFWIIRFYSDPEYPCMIVITQKKHTPTDITTYLRASWAGQNKYIKTKKLATVCMNTYPVRAQHAHYKPNTIWEMVFPSRAGHGGYFHRWADRHCTWLIWTR